MNANSLKNLEKRGRTKGAKSHGVKLKNAFYWVFCQMEGRKGLLKWACNMKNQREFYALCTKMFDAELKITGGIDINHNTRVLMMPSREFQDGNQVGVDKPNEAIQQPEKVTITPLLTHTPNASVDKSSK